MELRVAVLLVAGLFALPAMADEMADVSTVFRAAYPIECGDALDAATVPIETEVYELRFKASYDEAGAAPRDIRLYQFFCSMGAYNTGHVFFTASDDDGIQLVHFAQPTYTVVYEDEDANGAVTSITVTGITSYARLVNSEVDPVSGTIRATAWWRGLGDASSTGEWRLIDGDFSLVSFAIDASYDGEMNPVQVIDFATPTPVDLASPPG